MYSILYEMSHVSIIHVSEEGRVKSRRREREESGARRENDNVKASKRRGALISEPYLATSHHSGIGVAAKAAARKCGQTDAAGVVDDGVARNLHALLFQHM